MNGYVYIFYIYFQKDTREYDSFEDALDSFVYDFEYGKSYGIGIYDRETKILHLPNYFDKEEYNRAIKEIEKLGYEIKKIKTFEV